MKSTYNPNKAPFGIVRSITENGVLVSLFTKEGELVGEIIERKISKELHLGATFDYNLQKNMDIELSPEFSRKYVFSPVGYKN